MTTLIHLNAGTLRCDISPELGGSLMGLWLGETPVLRAAPHPTSARESSSYPLVPFSNRIGEATLQWQGTSHPLDPNPNPNPNPVLQSLTLTS